MSGPAPQSTLICMFKKQSATILVHIGIIVKRGAAQTAWASSSRELAFSSLFCLLPVKVIALSVSLHKME